MPRECIVIDGLWRCLCPSVDITTLSRLIGPPRHPRQRPILSPSSNIWIACRQSRREYRYVGSGLPSRNSQESVEQSRIGYLQRIAKRNPWAPGVLFRGVDAFITKLDRIPTKTLYAAIKELASAENTYLSVVKLVEYLVKERKEKPNAILYESLIRANIDRYYGSAGIARGLLEEMEKLNIVTTPQIYQAILDVTSVHPDYVLRNKALFEMKNRWYSPTTDDQISIIVGLLRDNQYELALEKLEAISKTAIAVPSWLYEIFLYTFGELGFHEETLSILKHRIKIADVTNEPLSPNTCQFLLDVFGRDAFYDGIKHIWDHSVSPGYINPPDGIVMNVLNTASNHGDAPLAMSAIQMLSSRDRRLELHHYEALVEIHAQQNDLRKAFTVLCIIAKTGLRPDLSSTRSIFRVLRKSPSETDNALAILSDLSLRYKVPSAAFNVVLEATGVHHVFTVTLDLYRNIRQFCADGPDLETYHILFSQCTKGRTINFLLDEMQTFSIEPVETTYDHLIRIASLQEDYEQAFQFLEKMKASKTAGLPNNWWISRSSALALIRRCIQAEDIRAQELIEGCRRRGMSIDTEVQQLLDGMQKQKELAEAEGAFPSSIEKSYTVPLDTVPASQNLNALSDSA
ncbi:uncharacterized protein GGS22DRAFT_150025 [Annulohypoxylon maeteangense]|uniref:uncharacterized protein n=1 Tax=Annulohypoxylon maeteangense TaxID=1927788 RepID=UPI0020075670|nr:uncharacterized protein GGS22DRAFT_150025 [Annulohypoxylon maeteangense]KAI0890113.1 hypothetical protein GGS22DRAFT_150025 [Annulohypoxylon maeteangense]